MAQEHLPSLHTLGAASVLGLVVPLGEWSDAVGRVKMDLCQRAGEIPGSSQGQEGDWAVQGAGRAGRDIPVSGAGAKVLLCPEGPGTGQAVVATEQRVGSREGRFSPWVHHDCTTPLQCPERCCQPCVGVASHLCGRKPFVGSRAISFGV